MTQQRDPRHDLAVTRYVVTQERNGTRTLAEPAQGRYTYPTAEDAEDRMKILQIGGIARAIGTATASTLEVRPCECWPGHFDPKGIYFDVD